MGDVTNARWERVRAALDSLKNRGGFWVDIADAALADLDAIRVDDDTARRAAVEAAAYERGATTIKQRAAELCDDSEASWAAAWKDDPDLLFSARRSEANFLGQLIRLLTTAPPETA